MTTQYFTSHNKQVSVLAGQAREESGVGSMREDFVEEVSWGCVPL